jgi:hypothetical protein
MHIAYQRLFELIQNQLALTTHERQHLGSCPCCWQVFESFSADTTLQLDCNVRRLRGC